MKGMIIGTLTFGILILYTTAFVNMAMLTFWALFAVGIILTLYGSYCWAKYKGRHWAYMFWGILAPIGLIALALLKPKEEEENK